MLCSWDNCDAHQLFDGLSQLENLAFWAKLELGFVFVFVFDGLNWIMMCFVFEYIVRIGEWHG